MLDSTLFYILQPTRYRLGGGSLLPLKLFIRQGKKKVRACSGLDFIIVSRTIGSYKFFMVWSPCSLPEKKQGGSQSVT